MNIGLNNTKDTNHKMQTRKGFSFSELCLCYPPFKRGFETVCGPILRRTHCWKLSV